MCEIEVNNIAIKLEKITFDKDTKDELNKFAKTYRMKVSYYYGYISKFEKLNVHTISPHKIIFSKYGYNLLVLHYDEYYENNNLYLIPNEKDHLLLVLWKSMLDNILESFLYHSSIWAHPCK